MPSITDTLNKKYGVDGSDIADAISKLPSPDDFNETIEKKIDDAINEKALLKPAVEGAATQVLVSDGEGGQVWAEVGEGEIVVDNTLTVSGAAADAKVTGDEITGLKSQFRQLDDIINGQLYEISPGTDNHGYYTASNNTLTYNNDSSSHSFIVDLSSFVGKTINVKFETTNTSSTRVTALANANGQYVSTADRIYERDMPDSGFDVYPSADYHILYISYSSNGSNLLITLRTTDSLINSAIAKETIFISVSGNDANVGTISSPLASVDKALELGASKIMVMSGKYMGQQIDLSKAKRKSISIIAYTNDAHSIFYAPEAILATSETKLSGYNNIYYSDGRHNFTSNNIWIFQDGIADQETLIDSAEIHPSQRGQTYRCLDTKIVKTTATSLSDALAEIDSASEYKFFYDSTNLRTYFSRPSAVNPTNPICASFGYAFFKNANREISLNLVGIETKYYGINVSNTANSCVKDCKASNVSGYGAFVYDNALSVIFDRCEASRCFMGSNGDGFNGHGTTTGEDFPKQVTATLIDCWSHDNNDDGYSDHERSETNIWGGLFEYNGKGGITPSYGSHCTCHDVLSRNNYNGFYYTGTKLDEGNGGQLVCYNCVAENNMSGGAKTGFLVDGNGNSMILYGCKSIGNRKGFDTTTQSVITAVDCSASGNEILKDGNVTVVATSALS